MADEALAEAWEKAAKEITKGKKEKNVPIYKPLKV